MASVTGQQIREELQKYGLILLLGQATATAGGADRLRDATRLDNSALSPTAFDNCFVRASGSAGNIDGQQVMVDYLDQDNGDLYVTPSWTAPPDANSTYEIWRAGINPDDVDRLRDEALTQVCSQWQLHPVSIVSNAGYFDGTTNWTAGASATRAQQTGTFPTELWPYTMLVTNDGATANGRIVSASIYTIRAEDYFYLYVPVSVRSGTAQVIVRDMTNPSNITLNGTATETRRGWSGIEVTGQIPATCDEIQVWLVGQEATAIVEWGPVFFYPQNWRRLPIDPRVDSDKKVGPVYYMLDYPVASGQGRWGEEDRNELPNVRKIRVNDAVQIQLDMPSVDLPYFYEERVYYAALQTTYLTAAGRTTGDAATTLCPIDYAAAATAKLIAEFMMIRRPEEKDFYINVLQVAENKLMKFEKLYGPKVKPSQNRERQIYIPSPRL